MVMVNGIDGQKGMTGKGPTVYVKDDVFIILEDGTRIIVKRDGRVIRPRTRVRGTAAENPGLLRLPKAAPKSEEGQR